MNTCFASMRGLIVTACYRPSYLHFNSSVETNEYDSISSTLSSLAQTHNTLLTTGIPKPPLRIENRNNGKREQRSLESCLWVLRDSLAQGELTEFGNGVTELRQSGLSLSNLLGYLDIKAVRLCLAQQIQNGRLKVTLEALKNLEQLGFNVHDLLDQNARLLLAKQCRKLLQQGFVKDCVDVVQILSDCLLHIENYVEPALVIQHCIKMRDVDLALRYVRLLPLPHGWYSFLIREFGKQGDLKLALSVFRQQQRGKGINVHLYGDMIDACTLSGNIGKAESIFEEMLRQKLTPSTYVYNTMLNARASDLPRALQIFKDMQISEVMPDVTTYNILLKACRIARNVDLALCIYKEIKAKSTHGHVKLDVVSYSTLIQIMGDAKKWQTAMEIKQEMTVAGIIPDMVTWTTLLSACANAGFVEKAQEMFDEMAMSGYQPNSQCCNALLTAFVKDHQYARAFNLFKSWKEKGFGFYEGSLKRYQISKNQCASAIATPNMRRFQPTVVSYNILMKACKSAPYHAEALIEEMTMNDILPDNVTWTTLIDAYGTAGDLEGCFKAFGRLCHAGIIPDVITYTSIIKACIRNKDFTKAFNVFQAMKQQLIQPNAVTYNTLLRGWCVHGDHFQLHALLTIYKDMRKSGFPPNDGFLKSLIEEWAEGIIQNNNDEYQASIRKRYMFPTKNKSKSRLNADVDFVEKIAALACLKRNNLTVDLHGLSETEARIVLLAVLRILRERHCSDFPIEDDLVIIVDVKKGILQKSILLNIVFKVLKEELGLPVFESKNNDSVWSKHISSKRLPQNSNKSTVAKRNLSYDGNSHDVVSVQKLPIVQRMIVPKKHLDQWIKKIGKYERVCYPKVNNIPWNK